MKRIKVLHLITHLGVGGALDNTLLTVERLDRDRYEVDLAAGRLPEDEGYSNWHDRSRACADRLFEVPSLKRKVQPLADLKAGRELAELIRKEQYDVVHTHCAKAGVVGRIAAKNAGVPIIVHTCHAFASQVTRTPNESFLHSFASRAKEKVFTRLERWAGTKSDQLVTVCDQNKLQAIEQRLAPADKITTIYSGIDLERFDVSANREQEYTALGFDPDRPLVALVGRLAKQKAPLDFVKAAKRVLQEKPETQFALVGDGPLTEAVQAEIGGEPNIRCTGYFERVPELLSVLDVLAVSSLWEGLGRSVTEALIMGVPVAATAVDGIPEIVQHEKTGLLSRPSDPNGLATNIIRLLSNPNDAVEMARRGQQRVRCDFGADRMVHDIDRLYRRLLSQKKILREPNASSETKSFTHRDETIEGSVNA